MTPRAPKANPHEVAGRERKMGIFIPAIEQLAAESGRDPVELAESLTLAEWRIIAAKESLDRGETVNPPSGTTITIMIGALRERARERAA